VSCKCPWKTEETLLIRARCNEAEAGTSHAAKSTQETTGKGKKSRLAANGDEVDMPVLERMVSPRSAGTSQSQKKSSSSPNKQGKNKEATKSKESNTPSSSTKSGGTASDKKKTPASAPKRRTRNNQVISSDSD